MGDWLVRDGAATVAHAREALAADLTDAGVCDEQIFDVLLVAGELIANAVSHARPLPGGDVRVSWDLRDRRARVEVRDGGAATVPTVRTDGPSQPGGRGLAIVEAIADSWGYESSERGCLVWAELILKSST